MIGSFVFTNSFQLQPPNGNSRSAVVTPASEEEVKWCLDVLNGSQPPGLPQVITCTKHSASNQGSYNNSGGNYNNSQGNYNSGQGNYGNNQGNHNSYNNYNNGQGQNRQGWGGGGGGK